MTNNLDRQKEYRLKTGNAATKRYEKTKNGFLMRLYRNMESRVNGIQRKKHHLYRGKELFSREEFYFWAKSSAVFHEMFYQWEYSGYDRKMTPSVDRVNSGLGYSIGNVEWVTHSENSRRGNYSRYAISR